MVARASTLPHNRLVQRAPSISALLVLLCCLAVPSFAPAAEDENAGQYYVKVWGADEGFAEGSVTDVSQTPEGYLWVGTLFGSVLRFDGARFVSYTSANTPGFVSKWGVPKLMVDATGALWISMHDGGMTIWDKQGFRPAYSSTNQPGQMLWSAPGKVIFIHSDGTLLSGELQRQQWQWQTIALPGSQHCADAEGHVWYLRNDHEIGIWEGSKTNILTSSSMLGGERIAALTADPKGSIWAGTERRLVEWQINHFETMTPTNDEAVIDVKKIVSSGAGDLWVEANGRMRRCARRQWLAESAAWEDQFGKIASLRFLHGDADGGLWASAGDLGLIHVLENGTLHRLTTRDGLPSDIVHFAFQDRDGNTWTGYERGGLVQIRRRLFRSIGKDQGLSDSLINTVSEDTNGNLWIGTHSGKINLYQDGACTNLVFPGDARALDSCAAAGSNGRIWLGGQGIGLLMYETGHVQHIAPASRFSSSQGYPRLLLPAKDGGLWFGTLMSIIHVNDGTLESEYTAATTGDHPTGLAQAADGTVWAGTLAGLLLRWDGKQFEPVEPPDRNALGRIWALWAPSDGGLWAGTEEGGLLHWKNGAFHRYTTKDGLPSDSIIQIVGDRQDNLWLGTRAGIVRISSAALNLYENGKLEKLPISIYGLSDGLLTIGSAIISQPNCWRARDGTLLFAMANSVAVADPEKVHVNPVPPTVALEELRANEKTLWPMRSGAILTAPPMANTSEPQATPFEIKVAPGRGDLEFRYAGPNLNSPLLVRFKYRLEGLESSWNEAGNERKATYRHVPPGDYVFHVKACNSDSIWSEDSALVAVTIAPFFYQTLFFRAAAAAFAVGSLSLALVSAYRLRVRRRLDQLQRQHELERERSRIAQDLHDDLGAGLTEIGLLGGLLQKSSLPSTRDRQGLDRIVQRCRDLVMALDEIVWAVNPRNDSMNSLGGYLARYAQAFLEPTSIRCRLEIEDIDSQQPFNSEQRHNLFLAFKETLTNVARHSGASEVCIRIFLENKAHLVVCIEDNGHGLPESVRESADGLINLRQRLTRIGGDCEITSRQNGGGVVVRLSLPVVSPLKDK
jgi:signal transduction histidine kinase/ligand-binding sensor domain-containing protein